MTQPKLSLIVAMTPERVIGAHNTMPWHLPADLAFFKATTMGCPIVMGRKTFQSIGRPLPGRHNIVLTRDKQFSAAGIEVAYSIEKALESCAGVGEVFVIGGAELFESTLSAAQRIYLTHIDAHLEGDTFFPELENGAWHETSRRTHPRDERNAYNLSFRVLERTAC